MTSSGSKPPTSTPDRETAVEGIALAAADGPAIARQPWVTLVRLLSIGLVLLAMRWIVLRLGADADALLAYRPSTTFLLTIALMVPVIAASELVPAYVWHRLLVTLGGADRAERRRHVLIHARLQIIRYLPGHAFLLGRHAVTRQAADGRRLPHSALGAAATCEAVAKIAGAAALVLLGFGLAFGDGALDLGDAVPAAALRWAPWLAVGLVLGMPLIVARLAGGRLLPGVVGHRPTDLIGVFGLQAAYFAVQGLVFGLLLTIAHGGGELAAPWPKTFFAGAAALPLGWLIGYMTPATPAGAGALEAVLVATLGARYGAVEVLAAAIGFRVASITGHGVLALAAAWLGRRDGFAADPRPEHSRLDGPRHHSSRPDRSQRSAAPRPAGRPRASSSEVTHAP